jgi:hypothetical protein
MIVLFNISNLQNRLSKAINSFWQIHFLWRARNVQLRLSYRKPMK